MISMVPRLWIQWGGLLRRALRIVCIALTVAGLAVTGWSLVRGHDLKTLSNVAGIVGSLGGTLGTFSTKMRTVRVDAQILDNTANNLAEIVATEARARRERLLGAEFRAIDIGYHYVPEPGRNAANAAERGSFREIAEYYRRLEPQRLVMTGSPGSGKTLLAIELMIQMLEDRAGRGRVPFLTSLSTWDTEIRFIDWLSEQIAAAHSLPLRLASALVEQGRIIAVLDGLDEMDAVNERAPRAEAALEQLITYHGPLVLTCRTDEYNALRARGCRLWDCALIEIDAVTSAQARDYLLSRAPDVTQWQDIVEDIQQVRSGALAATLTTPWLLTLASTIALAEGSPRMLARFVGAAAHDGGTSLEEQLLEHCVPSLTRLHPVGNGRYYDGAHVQLWCSRLARFLKDSGGRTIAGHVVSGTDIVLHQLWPLGGMRKPRLVTAALTVALWLPLLGTATASFAIRGYLPFPGIWALLIAVVPPAMAAWGGLGYWLQPRQIVVRRLLTANGAKRFGLSLMLGCLLAVSGAVAFSPQFGVAYATGFVLVCGFGLPMSVRWDIHLEATLSTALLVALALGAGAGALGSTRGMSAGLLAGLAAGAVALFVSVRFGIRLARRQGGGLPDDEPGTPGPLTALRGDLMAGNIAGVIAGGVAFVIAWQAPWLALPLPLAILLGAAAFLAAGPGFVAETSRRYLAMLLVTRRRLPWRLGRFLDWASQAGILRTAATAYQFRHSRLQHWLARAGNSRQP